VERCNRESRQKKDENMNRESACTHKSNVHLEFRASYYRIRKLRQLCSGGLGQRFIQGTLAVTL